VFRMAVRSSAGHGRRAGDMTGNGLYERIESLEIELHMMQSCGSSYGPRFSIGRGAYYPCE
jgi:hypothetical protein